jgi:hypothetical protein
MQACLHSLVYKSKVCRSFILLDLFVPPNTMILCSKRMALWMSLVPSSCLVDTNRIQYTIQCGHLKPLAFKVSKRP